MECLSYCVAEKIDLHELEKKARLIDYLTVSRQSQVLVLQTTDQKQACFVFSNGSLVTWGIKRYQMRPYFVLLDGCGKGLLPHPVVDAFTYKYSKQTMIYPHPYFSVDCFELEDQELELKLSLSYGLSQSIKLQHYQEQLEKRINRYLPLTNQLSRTGRIILRHKKIQKIIGDILTFKAQLNLVSDFLYQPKFFWQHPNLERNYLKIQDYMDIPERTNILNEKLNTLSEIFLMFNSYLETKHEYRLEIIIIVLIAIEIIFNVLNLHL